MRQQSIVYSFLLSPRFRIWRYLSLIVFFSIVSLNQALVGYKKIMPLMEGKVYWIIAGTILVYVIMVYLILHTVLRDLSSGNYSRFVVFVVLCALLFTSIPNVVYLLYIDGFDLLSKSTIIDNLSAYIIFILCISGVIIPVFLKNWVVSNQHINQLKRKQEASRIEKLKEQINPASFFKILNKSGDLVKTDPDNASAMLIKLGQLLRYQLYDCNQKQVLLSAEVSFLKNYFELEILSSSRFDYKINTEGSNKGVFISPSVLLPYVQCATNVLKSDDKLAMIDFSVDSSGDKIAVFLKIEGLHDVDLLQQELSNLKERLNSLCEGSYELTSEILPCKSEICLLLNKQ